MREQVRRLFFAPIFASEEQTQRARIFHAVVWVTMAVATSFLIAAILVQTDFTERGLIALFVVDLSGVTFLEVSRRGRTRLASALFVATLIVLVSILALTAGGIRAFGVTMYFVLTLMAGLLLGERAGILTAIVCSLLGLGMVLAERFGLLPAQTIQYDAITLWLLNCMYMGVVIFLLRLSTQAVGEALGRAKSELAERREAELERDEAERHRQILEIQLRQSQKMEALGTLAGGIAHDFNNILGTIQGFAQILAADLAQGTPQHGFAQRVLAACDRGKVVVEQILAFARSGVHDRLVIDLARTVRECEALLVQSLPKPTQLEFVLANEPLHARAHVGQISQLILNLGRNASDSLDGNPGRVKVELYRPSREEIAARKEFRPQPNNLMIGTVDVSQAYACIAVSDNGSGIPPEILKRIFDPFFTTKGRQRGTGLGLAVAHGVIEAHGGACCVETVPAKGTRFSFYLPITSEAPQLLSVPAAGATTLRGHERVLIVDDEQDIADMLAIGLDRLGYEVAAVIDPLEALSAFEEDPDAWDAVIADQLMPQMRGVEFLRKLKTARPNIKTVLCTGFSEGAEGELVASGAIDLFVQKPTDAQGIASSLRILFDKSERPAAADAHAS